VKYSDKSQERTTSTTRRPASSRNSLTSALDRRSEHGRHEADQYTARDGLVIHGYLTLPRGWTRSTCRCGESAWRTMVSGSLGLQPETQFLANRGYAVLQMNFRGSTAMDGLLGGLLQAVGPGHAGRYHRRGEVAGGAEDRRPEADRDLRRIIRRLRHAGGLTVTPDLYACGVDYVGVSNLFTFLTASHPTGSWDARCVRNGRRSGKGQGSPDRGIADLPRRPDQGAASRGPGANDPG